MGISKIEKKERKYLELKVKYNCIKIYLDHTTLPTAFGIVLLFSSIYLCSLQSLLAYLLLNLI